jgi:hypothetical protein
MKSGGSGTVIGQAMTSYDGQSTGSVEMFVKNFDVSGDPGDAPLLGDISPEANADGTDNGLSSLVAAIQAENSSNPVAIIASKITEGKKFLTDFISARVTAIRGYFDELFARKIHTEDICLKKSDGNEVCVNGDQLDSLLQNAVAAPVINPAPNTTEVPAAAGETAAPEATPAPAAESAPAGGETAVQ